MTVVLTLRADYYDRPLLHPEFAELLTAGWSTSSRWPPRSSRSRCVEPARRVGVEVEPALLAELVADTTDQPGALPLLQFTLAELFEPEYGAALSLADYRAAGRPARPVSRRCEEASWRWTPTSRGRACRSSCGSSTSARQRGRRAGERRARAHRTGRRSRSRCRPCSRSSAATGCCRSTATRPPATPRRGRARGAAVGVATTRRMDRDAPRGSAPRTRSLAVAADEWESTGRDPDYLIAGSQARRVTRRGAARTTSADPTERAFLDSALERRRAEERRRDRATAARTAEPRVGLGAGRGARGARRRGRVGVRTWMASRPPDVALVFYERRRSDRHPTEAGFDRAVSSWGSTPRSMS